MAGSNFFQDAQIWVIRLNGFLLVLIVAKILQDFSFIAVFVVTISFLALFTYGCMWSSGGNQTSCAFYIVLMFSDVLKDSHSVAISLAGIFAQLYSLC